MRLHWGSWTGGALADVVPMSLMGRGRAGSEHTLKRKSPTAGHRHRDGLGSDFSREICAGWEKGGGSSQPLPCSVLAVSMAGPVVDTKSVVTAPVPHGIPVGWKSSCTWGQVTSPYYSAQGVQGHPLNLTSPQGEQPGVFLLSQVQTEQLLEGTPASGCRSRQVLAG